MTGFDRFLVVLKIFQNLKTVTIQFSKLKNQDQCGLVLNGFDRSGLVGFSVSKPDFRTLGTTTRRRTRLLPKIGGISFNGGLIGNHRPISQTRPIKIPKNPRLSFSYGGNQGAFVLL
jgi:hypothetical protein